MNREEFIEKYSTKPGMCQRCGDRPKKARSKKCLECWEISQPVDWQKSSALLSYSRTGGSLTVLEDEKKCAWCHKVGRVDRGNLKFRFSPSSKSYCRICTSLNSQRRLYSMSVETQKALWSNENTACSICGAVQRVSGLAVDHDHKSGEVRGLLCGKGGASCNEVIGYWHDDPKRFVRAAKYLLSPPTKPELTKQQLLELFAELL